MTPPLLDWSSPQARRLLELRNHLEELRGLMPELLAAGRESQTISAAEWQTEIRDLEAKIHIAESEIRSLESRLSSSGGSKRKK